MRYVTIRLALAWARAPWRAWRGRAVWEAAPMIAAIIALSAIAPSNDLPLTYLVFPALIWAAPALQPAGATLAVAVAAGTAVGITANEVGTLVQHSITDSALSTQLYIAVATLTTLCLAAVVSERHRSPRAGRIACADRDGVGERRHVKRGAARQRTEPP